MPIASLRVGDVVYSVDAGRTVAVRIVRTSRNPVSEHRVVRVTLASGSVVEMSARHPTADGRSFGDLHPGDSLDGIEITDVRIVPYAYDATYDILPGSDTGAYFAGGVLVGSTLARDAVPMMTASVPLCTSAVGTSPRAVDERP
jgi:ribosomal protein S8E